MKTHENEIAGPVVARLKDFAATYGPYLTNTDKTFIETNLEAFDNTGRLFNAGKVAEWISNTARHVDEKLLKANKKPVAEVNNKIHALEALRDHPTTSYTERRAAQMAINRIKADADK